MYREISLVILILLSQIAYALPNDNKEKLIIISDSSIYNVKTGSTTFVGHVKVNQGSTHLTASRLITKNNRQHRIEEAIAYGTDELAHYWTLPKIGNSEMHAHAKIIKLYPIQSNVTLEQNVILANGSDHFQGELIIYNNQDQTVIIPEKQNAQAILTYYSDKN